MLGKFTCAVSMLMMMAHGQQELAIENLVQDAVREMRAPREGAVETAQLCDPRYMVCDGIDTRIDEEDSSSRDRDTSGLEEAEDFDPNNY